MSSLGAMLETSSVNFQHVNERAAYVKLTVIPVGVDLGRSKHSNFSCCRMAFDHLGFMNKNQKVLGVLG